MVYIFEMYIYRIAKLRCDYISTEPCVGLLLDFEWVLGTFCYFDPNCGSKSLSSNPHWLFEYLNMESFLFSMGSADLNIVSIPSIGEEFLFWGISIYERKKYSLESIIMFFKRNYILRIITGYLVSVSCLTGICFFWCKDLQTGILDSLSKATRRETFVKIVPKSSSPPLFSSCSHKVWMNHDPSL